jgi:hypothetical protein
MPRLKTGIHVLPSDGDPLPPSQNKEQGRQDDQRIGDVGTLHNHTSMDFKHKDLFVFYEFQSQDEIVTYQVPIMFRRHRPCS